MTVKDAQDVYAAIRRARPGGLGRSDTQDVASEPDVTLLEAMRLAADRDGIAREYATAFAVTFERGAPTLTRARADGLSWSDAVVETYLSLLAHSIDTHIVRRTGVAAAERVSSLAREALEAGGVRSAAGRQAVEEMDRAMRDARNSNNPGTTADLTAAAIFVTLVARRPPDYDRAGPSLDAPEDQCHHAGNSAFRSRKTIWSSPRRTSSHSPGIAAKDCTVTTIVRASPSKATSTRRAGSCSTSSS